MKRSFRTIFLLALSLLLLTVTALADTGPKSKLTVKVKNAPRSSITWTSCPWKVRPATPA